MIKLLFGAYSLCFKRYVSEELGVGELELRQKNEAID